VYLDRLSITGYKCFDAEFSIDLSPGVNVLVGENAVGKSAIIDAIRLVLREDEFGHRGIRDTDFHCAFTKGAHSVGSLRIKAHLDKLTEEQRVAFLPWSDAAGKATLTMHVDNKLTAQDRYRPVVWGGASRASAFEWELFDTIKCIYLPPLRDAEAKLSDGRGSRLARFIRNLNTKELGTAKKANTKHPLEEHMRKFNEDLASDKGQTIHQANELIRSRLKDALGPVFGQDTSIQFSEVSFSRIVESLRLLFFPKAMSKVDTDVFRGLEENSLGYNNLLYLATVLAELTLPHTQTEYLKVLLIEEPEAHLHPQIQVRLLRYLQSTAKEAGVQVIVSTHSPVLAASASLDSLIHIVGPGTEPASATGLKSCGFSITSKPFVTRWLDATKSTLFFSRGVLLVEGIAESLVIPELAKLVLATHNDCAKKNKKEALPETLEDAGVSVINMNGIYFRHFMQAFCDLKEAETTACIPVRCAGITDQDPVKTIKYAADPKKGIPYRPTPKDIETRKDVMLQRLRSLRHLPEPIMICLCARQSTLQSGRASFPIRYVHLNTIWQWKRTTCPPCARSWPNFVMIHPK